VLRFVDEIRCRSLQALAELMDRICDVVAEGGREDLVVVNSGFEGGALDAQASFAGAVALDLVDPDEAVDTAAGWHVSKARAQALPPGRLEWVHRRLPGAIWGRMGGGSAVWGSS
jgi:hypothetical protein